MVPDPEEFADAGRGVRGRSGRWPTWTSTPGTPLRDIAVDVVFVGSCTNGRLEDLRAAADVLRGHKVADGVRMLVVPGSARVRAAAEAEGLDKVFTDAGAEWRFAGCSMCLGMNPDTLKPGQRSRLHVQPQLRGPAGPGRAYPPGLAARRRRDRRRRPPRRPRRPVSEKAATMEKFTVHTGIAVPLRRSDVDTDQIIPAEYLKRVTRTGFEDGLFNAWRADPTFVLNDPGLRRGLDPGGRARGSASARRANTPCGRLQDYGFRAVIAPSFGDIFRNNALKGGLLPVVLPEKLVEELWILLEEQPGVELTVDLVAARRCVGPDRSWDFPLDEHSRWRLHGGPRRHRADPAPRRRDHRVRGHAARSSRLWSRSGLTSGFRRGGTCATPLRPAVSTSTSGGHPTGRIPYDPTIFAAQMFVSCVRRDYCARRMAV